MGSIDILKSLLFFESSAIGAAADAAVKIAGLKSSGKTREIADSLKNLSDQVQRLYDQKVGSIIYGHGQIDVGQLISEATSGAVEGFRR